MSTRRRQRLVSVEAFRLGNTARRAVDQSTTPLGIMGFPEEDLLGFRLAHSVTRPVLLTDQNLQFQQNLATLPIAVVVLVADSNRLESLEPLVPEILEALKTMQPKTLVRVGA